MRITCPSCAAAYDVPDERLAPGRTVKCAQCGTGWAPILAVLRTAPAPPPPAPKPEPPPEPPNLAPVIERFTKPPAPPMPRPVPAPKPAPPPDTSSTIVTAGWAASIGLLLLLAGAAYAWRVEVMQAWPASERAYALLGLARR